MYSPPLFLCHSISSSVRASPPISLFLCALSHTAAIQKHVQDHLGFHHLFLLLFLSGLLYPSLLSVLAQKVHTHPHKGLLFPAVPGPLQHLDTRTTSKQLGGNTSGAYCLQSDRFFSSLAPPFAFDATWYGPGIQAKQLSHMQWKLVSGNCWQATNKAAIPPSLHTHTRECVNNSLLLLRLKLSLTSHRRAWQRHSTTCVSLNLLSRSVSFSFGEDTLKVSWKLQI